MATRKRHRFYDRAEAARHAGGYAVQLDGRPVKTPGGSPLAVPSRTLAQALAAEWQDQAETIDPETLPLTRLASTAIDRIAGAEAAMVTALVAYGETDTLCYRDAAEPLASRQARAWQPWLAWLAEQQGVELMVSEGLMPVRQDPATLDALRAAIAAQDAWHLAALGQATQAAGSIVVGLALTARAMSAETAFDVAQLEQTYQIEQWGTDPEAEAQRRSIARDLTTAATFVERLEAP